MEQLKKSPEVRFKGFDDEWEADSFKNLTIINQGLQISIDNRYKKKISNSHFYITNEFLKEGAKSEYYILNPPESVLCTEDDVLMTRTGNTGEVVTGVNGAFHNNFFKIKFDRNKIDKGYLVYFLKNEATQSLISRLAGVSTIPDLNHNDFYQIEMPFPKIKEQNKISSLISNLDSSIKNHQTQLKKLKNLKKAMLVKMFPLEGATVPEIRFKGFDGEWESYKLGNIGNTFTGLSGKTKEDFGKGEARYIPYTNVFNNEVTDRNQLEKIEIDESQSAVHYGDVLFTTSSETPEEVGMSSVWLEKDENVYLNSFCFGYRFKEKVDNYFIAYYMRSQYFRENMKILAQGISRFNISKTKVMEIDILLPEETEQTKVGKYFTNLDKIIIGHEVQLKKLNNIKKACLSKMFVA